MREIAGLTQKDVAELVGMKKEVWTKYEKGQLSPKAYHMVIICNRFKVSPDYIYRGTLFGVHPGIGQELVARMPDLVRRTKSILQGMGIDISSDTPPRWWLPLE
jgi:transcriptional regulator with XRE-family HTH domain